VRGTRHVHGCPDLRLLVGSPTLLGGQAWLPQPHAAPTRHVRGLRHHASVRTAARALDQGRVPRRVQIHRVTIGHANRDLIASTVVIRPMQGLVNVRPRWVGRHTAPRCRDSEACPSDDRRSWRTIGLDVPVRLAPCVKNVATPCRQASSRCRGLPRLKAIACPCSHRRDDGRTWTTNPVTSIVLPSDLLPADDRACPGLERLPLALEPPSFDRPQESPEVCGGAPTSHDRFLIFRPAQLPHATVVPDGGGTLMPAPGLTWSETPQGRRTR
jgi:hypothetical protein